MRAGAGQMQIEARTPRELVDVLQAVILLVLVALPVLARATRRARRRAVPDEAQTITPSYAQRDRCRPDGPVPVRHPAPRRCVFQLVGYLDRDPADERPDHPAGGHADRLRRPVRRHVRAIGRGQHRHRGHDARRPRSPAGSSAIAAPRSLGPMPRRPARASRRRSSSALVAAVLSPSLDLAAPRLAVDQPAGRPDHQRHDHQHRRVRRSPATSTTSSPRRRRRAPASSASSPRRQALIGPAGRRLARSRRSSTRARSRCR